MPPSPAKRRKVSPTASVPGSVPNTPSRIPVPRGAADTTPGRPSFASPTKASIAKHNPQLLNRPQSSGVDTASPGKGTDALQPQPGSSLFVTPSQADDGKSLPTQGGTQTVQSGPATPLEGSTKGGRSTRSVGGLSAAPRRRSRTPGKEKLNEEGGPAVATESNSATTPYERPPSSNVEDALPPDPFQRAGLRRSPIASKEIDDGPSKITGLRKSPVTSQAPEPTLTGDPFQKAGLRRSPVASQSVEPLVASIPDQRARLRSSPAATQASVPVAVESIEREEPELPLTPTQRGLADPVVTTPPAGIHNTPSKRRKKRPKTTKPKSSRLKPQPEPEAQKVPELQPVVDNIDKKRTFDDYKPRHLIPVDAYAEKRKIRDDLLEETRQLQADIVLAEQENERQRVQHKSRKQVAAASPNPEKILDLLTRSTTSTESRTHPKPSSIIKSINLFLPFAKRRRPHPPPKPQQTPLPSHLPVTQEDPTPHLKLFTPLTFTSTIFLLPPTPPSSNDSSSDILQSHTITSRAPSGLLTTRLTMIVNTTTFSISSLRVEKVDASAEPELGKWIRERAIGKGVLGRDVNAIFWAMGRWFESAVKRARFWLVLEKEQKVLKGPDSDREMVDNFHKADASEAEEGLEKENEDRDRHSERQKWTRRQLMQQMGRRDLVIKSQGIELRIEWVIGFDWTGEAESTISASARVPVSWQQEDRRSSIAKVPETFDKLVKTRGPLAATRALVVLLNAS